MSELAMQPLLSPPAAGRRALFQTEALRLESLLAGHGIAARVGQASLARDRISYPVRLGLGATARRLLGLTETLATEAGYPDCHLRREGRTLFLDLPRAAGATLRYGDLLQIAGRPPEGSALVGVTEGGGPLAIPFANPAVHHLLVSGRGAAGKSALLRLIALGVAAHHRARDWRLALLPARPDSPLAPLADLPHCWRHAERVDGAIGTLLLLLEEARRRRRGQARGARVVVLIDEACRLLAEGGELTALLLRSLLRDGAAVGIHLVVAVEDGAALGRAAALFPARLEANEEGRAGQFLLHSGQNVVPVETAHVGLRESTRVVSAMRAARPRIVVRPAEGRTA